MSRGKKRKHDTDSASDNQNSASSKHYTPVKKDLLLPHYPLVRTLRQHMLASLPYTSKVRRKRIAALGSSIEASELEAQLAHVLDTALVGCSQLAPRSESEENTWQQWLSFSQKGDESYVTISNGIALSIDQQSEVCICLPNCT
jgi:telomerase reverse transcriptase